VLGDDEYRALVHHSFSAKGEVVGMTVQDVCTRVCPPRNSYVSRNLRRHVAGTGIRCISRDALPATHRVASMNPELQLSINDQPSLYVPGLPWSAWTIVDTVGEELMGSINVNPAQAQTLLPAS
jgi:hypothetical protein